jgi:L-ascorbate metabolism protein UlaG (beta-lactamase superfamily)
MSADQAASAVKAFQPRIVYPYHYGQGGDAPHKFADLLKGTPATEVRIRDWYAYS